MARKEIRELEKKLVQMQTKLLNESLDLMDNYVDPREAYLGPDGEMWNQVGSFGPGRSNLCAGFVNEQKLAEARDLSRWLCESNEYAINAIENRISYVTGTGHTYDVATKKATEVDPELVKQTQDYLDEWVYRNNWGDRQQENSRRLDRDGEVFIRYFFTKNGLRVRYVEPFQVRSPGNDPRDSFGIRCDAEDAETKEGYWVQTGDKQEDLELIEADQIQHRKANTDSNVKRGIPLLWPVRQHLQRIEKIHRNIALCIEIQTAIALVRRHKGSSESQVSSFKQGRASYTHVSSVTGQTRRKENFRPGSIIDVDANTEYDFPASGLNVANFAAGVQQLLRAVASRLVMPEFMLTSDASNGNYASTLVAEGPVVKLFQRLQATMIRDDLEVMWKVVECAVKNGALPDEALTVLEIQATPPSLKSRDEDKEASRDKILFDAKILSPQTYAGKYGLDFDQERKNILSLAQMGQSVAPQDPQQDQPADIPTPEPEVPSEEPQADAGVQAALTLNGAQVSSALEVLLGIRQGTLSVVAAVELMVGVGFDRDQATSMVTSMNILPPINNPAPTPEVPKMESTMIDVKGAAFQGALVELLKQIKEEGCDH